MSDKTIRYLLVGDDEKRLFVSDKDKNRCALYDKNEDKWIYLGAKLWELSVGFDPYEPVGSPYRWGSTSYLPDMVDITKEEAETIINKKIDEEMIIKLLRL